MEAQFYSFTCRNSLTSRIVGIDRRRVMQESYDFLGLYVHAETIAAAIAAQDVDHVEPIRMAPVHVIGKDRSGSPERLRDHALWCGETLFSSLSSTVADGGAGT